MLIQSSRDIKYSQITPKEIYLNRRSFLKQIGVVGLSLSSGLAHPDVFAPKTLSAYNQKFPDLKKSVLSAIDEDITDKDDAIGFTNFYEFSTEKSGPAKKASLFKTSPWTVKVEGEVNKPGDYHLEDLVNESELEERIYRLRCVEGWSMVIPWVGIPLGRLIERFDPTSQAAYVEFTTLLDKKQMPGQNSDVLPWPYVEGLRLDEARHPLTILAVGMYGEILPNQNGAPLRLVVPWKYGFKSIKSIVKIKLTRKQPRTTWNFISPQEYGFYANVNPNVSHPRWSQEDEERIGRFFRQKTQMFNGYADQVANLYQGMDLTKNF